VTDRIGVTSGGRLPDRTPALQRDGVAVPRGPYSPAVAAVNAYEVLARTSVDDDLNAANTWKDRVPNVNLRIQELIVDEARSRCRPRRFAEIEVLTFRGATADVTALASPQVIHRFWGQA
jgi:hypothetical protein